MRIELFFNIEAHQFAAQHDRNAPETGLLIAALLPLDDIALAREQVERGAGGRVLLSLATPAPALA